MKLQENMMTFTVFAAGAYGLWFYLAPASYFSLMMMPADLVNAVAINQLQNTGIGLFLLAYLFNVLRKGTTDSSRSELMQHHAIGWGTWGVLILAMMTASGQLNAGNLFMWASHSLFDYRCSILFSESR